MAHLFYSGYYSLFYRGGRCSAAVVTVNETEMVRLECTLNCGCSRTELTWVRADGNPLPSEADMSFSDSGRSVYLTFDSVPRRAGGVYVCVATHSTLGNATLY